MKKVFRLSVLLAVFATTLVGCKKEEGGGGSGKLSPPTWIQGTWGNASTGYVYAKFTKNDVILGGVSFAEAAEAGAKIKEKKNTSSVYELFVQEGGETGTYTFKKGKDSTLEFYTDTESLGEGEYYILDKL